MTMTNKEESKNCDCLSILTDRLSTLIDAQFTVIGSLNTVVDRIYELGERQEKLLLKNEELLRQARQEFLQRIIEEAVELEIEKQRRKKGNESS